MFHPHYFETLAAVVILKTFADISYVFALSWYQDYLGRVFNCYLLAHYFKHKLQENPLGAEEVTNQINVTKVFTTFLLWDWHKLKEKTAQNIFSRKINAPDMLCCIKVIEWTSNTHIKQHWQIPHPYSDNKGYHRVKHTLWGMITVELFLMAHWCLYTLLTYTQETEPVIWVLRCQAKFESIY